MPLAALAPGASIAAVAGRPAPHAPRASTLGRVAPLLPRARVVVAAGLPPFQSDAEQDVDDMTALLGVTYDYPSVQPPPPAEAPPALEFDAPPTGTPPAPLGAGAVGSSLVTSAGSAKVLDLFERAATPIGTLERAEAALAAARAIQSPGIIKVEPGSTVKRSQPKGDESLREATESKAAMVNFAKPLSQRRAAEDATRRAQEEARKAMDPTERLRAINAANSEDAAARARILAENREREARKFQNASSFYGGGGGGSSGSAGGYSPGGGFASAAEPAKVTSGPASDFWEWAPPEDPNRARRNDSPYYAPPEPQRQMAPAYTRRVEAAVAVMERSPEKTLELQFQSAVENQNATLPPLQSEQEGSAEVEALSAAAAAPAAAVVEAPAVEASLEDALSSPVRELGADGAKEGTLAGGARWWREEGKEYLEEGKVMSWTVIRGTSADGSVEWEEKFWETSDPYTYRELGAVKSGRDSTGQAWQESWKEIYQHDVNGTPFIHREASKWSHTPAGQCWSEGWTEDYRSDGSVDRYCEKTGSLEDGAAPEDGHANRWTEKWGEKWDGKGGCIKWTDTWASRDHAEGGQADAPGRSWGEKWEEKWGGSYNDGGRAGTRQGVTWDEMGGGHREKTWGEEHYPDGRLHKYGNSSDGSQYWDEWGDGGGGWWERMPSFGWNEALGHSPNLMGVPLQPRTGGGAGGAKGRGGVSIITPHRGSRRRVE